MKLYVGNLPPTFTDKDLEELFASYGDVRSAKMIMDRETGRSKRFGFVELSSKDEGMKAIEALDKKVIGKEPITVNEARPLERRDNNSPFKKNYR
jgi:RNA recognition motif-containing protein